MTDPTNSLPATTTTPQAGPALTGPLNSWLLVERSDAVAVETIRKSPILMDEARRAMPALKAEALRPATHDQIKAVISTRFALFPQPQRNAQEWAAWWADYFDAMDGLTPFAVEAGMAAWVRSADAEFMCKPGKLRELATTVPSDNRWAKAHYRAQLATAAPRVPLDEKPERIAGPKPTREEIADVMASFKMTMEAKDPLLKMRSKFERPSPCARVDEAGVSPEMRELLARRYA